MERHANMIYNIDFKRPIVIEESTLNEILSEEYGVKFYLQQWAFYDGEPVANYTLWEMTITNDLSEVEYSCNDEYPSKDNEENFLNNLIDKWLEKAKSNEDIAWRPSENERIDPQILLWRMVKQGKIPALGEVKIYINW